VVLLALGFGRNHALKAHFGALSGPSICLRMSVIHPAFYSFAVGEKFMSMPEPRSARSWQEIAEEASHEMNPKRLAQLAEELARAFDERDKKLTKHGEHKVAKNEAA